MNLTSLAKSILGLIFLFSSLLITNQVKAQYSYAGFHLGYTWNNLQKGTELFGGDNGARINELTSTLNFMNRPIRRVGIGASFSIPVIRGFTWNYSDAPTTNGGDYYEIDKEFGSQSSEYTPNEYEYNVQNRLGITLIGRLYFSKESSWYFDLRYTFSSVNETFIFNRSASSGLAARNINYDQSHAVRGPGFEFGGLAQFHDHFYLNYGFTVDYISYEVASFRYDIEYSSSNKVTFRSKIPENSFMFQFHYGIGYRF